MHTVIGGDVCFDDFAHGIAGNATTNDLWAAISKASEKDINTFMVSPLEFS